MKNSFITIWIGQSLSLLGSGVTNFALGIWVYQTTGSVFDFALIMLLITASGILVLPLSGYFIDKWSKKITLICCDAFQALILVGLLFLLTTKNLELYVVYFLVILRALLSKVQSITFNTLPRLITSQLSQLKWYASLTQISASIRLFSPVFAGVVLQYGIKWILAFDIITFFVAVLTVLISDFARNDLIQPKHDSSWELKEVSQGIKYLNTHVELKRTSIWLSFITFAVASTTVLFTPLILTISNEKALGFLLGAGGVGTVLGALTASKFGAKLLPSRSIMYCGVFICGVAINPSLLWLAVCIFGCFFSSSFALVKLKAYWYKEVPVMLQGRIFAIRDALIAVALPLGYLFSPWILSLVLEPWLTANDQIVGFLMLFTGYEEKQGFLIIFLTMGLSIILSTFLFHYTGERNGNRCI
ncbi:MFS transporter [Pleionea litopenaei]|uniref:MFS transporter n=1 Tax=Pleionea litopenaei TaxID=3070815 RepID=A0AA51RWY7_9GAMM|nr:MFS transporter [Pleionea sp. HL-JVS1]WMS89286.1 MFS transporter [Pleionea sp. HL-JVS1]WMS89307.1 MFS transporter [Pleionea sp. HL-JVS1]